MDGVEEIPVEVGKSHGHVPRVDTQQSDRLLSQLRTFSQGRLRDTNTITEEHSGFKPQKRTQLQCKADIVCPTRISLRSLRQAISLPGATRDSE